MDLLILYFCLHAAYYICKGPIRGFFLRGPISAFKPTRLLDPLFAFKLARSFFFQLSSRLYVRRNI